MLGKKEEEEEEEKEGEKEETLSTLLEDMQSVVASFLDPASLCALALSSRHFFFKFFKSNAFWGPNLTTLCLRNGHVGLFKYALETLKAPLAQEEVVVHAALSSPSPFPLAFVEYLLRNVKSGFGFTTHPMPSEVYKATSKFLALIARVARDLSPKEFLLHPSFASMLDLFSSWYHIRLYHAFIEGNCFELMKFISYGMWKRLNFPKGKVKGEEGIEEEKGNSVFEFLTMMQESSKNDRPTLAADNIKMFLLMRNLDVESFQEEDDYVEVNMLHFLLVRSRFPSPPLQSHRMPLHRSKRKSMICLEIWGRASRPYAPTWPNGWPSEVSVRISSIKRISW